MSLPGRHHLSELHLETSPHVGGVARVLPEHRYSQEEILEALEKFWQDQHHNPQRLRRFFQSVQVGGRHLAVPLDRYSELTDFKAKNDAFIEEGTRLGAEAVRQSLEAVGLGPDDVDAIFFTSITGIATPSIDARIVNVLGLPREVKRIPMFGLGCLGGAAGLARMADYLRAFPHHVAVLLSVELCSLTLQPEDLSVKNLIASGLFGDGVAAVVGLGAARKGTSGHAAGPRIVDTCSTFYPNTEWVMGWEISGDGFEVVLSADLPNLIRREVRGDVDAFLRRHALTRSDIGVWVMHSGGPAVLEAMQDAMEVPAEAFQITWESLASVGNMSSASVLFVLADTLEASAGRPGDVGLLMAMGPGFCAEQVLLQW